MAISTNPLLMLSTIDAGASNAATFILPVGNDSNSRVEGSLERLNKLNLVVRRNQDRVWFSPDHSVHDRHLFYDSRVRRALIKQFYAKRRCGCFCTSVHGDVEGIGRGARNERNSVFLIL